MNLDGFAPHVVARAHNLAALAMQARGLIGSFVECGVQDGWSAACIAEKIGPRHVWLFDSFEGLPEPGAEDGGHAAAKWARKGPGWCKGSQTQVRTFFAALQWPAERLHIVPGWFSDTLPKTQTGPIALLHLDADWYASTRACLERFWPDLVVGGILRLDDYWHWPGCKQAADEYFRARGIDPARSDPALGYWWVVKR